MTGNMKKCLIYILFVPVIISSGCKKIIETHTPSDQLTNDKIFNSDDNVVAALLNVYGSLSALDANTIAILGLYTDELSYNNSNASIVQFSNGKILPGNPNVGNIWKYTYSIIYKCNLLIEGLADQKNTISPGVRSQVSGEAKFLRAWSYFLLVNIYGDVPLTTTPEAAFNAVGPRAPAIRIYDQVKADLIDAKSTLTPAYPSPGKARVNRWAVVAFLARVYLYLQDWTGAAAEASSLLQSGTYQLASLNDVSATGNPGAIWQLWTRDGFSNLGTSFIPSSGIPVYNISPDFLSGQEPNDQRILAWLKQTTVNGMVYTYPYKYKNRSMNMAHPESTIYLRLAEQLLIRAEANAQAGQIPTALTDINLIRDRSGLSPIFMPVTKDSCLMMIEKQRRVELFTEGCHRFFDLKRTGRLDAVEAALKPAWKPDAKLFPLPASEIQFNPALLQNPGY